jgi:hypothetical protein
MRIPVDHVPATLILHDGTRLEIVMFVPPGEQVGDQLCSGAPFMPIRCEGKIRLVARDIVACITVGGSAVANADLPEETQRVAVRLRSGTTVEGELRWTAAIGKSRTADHLNEAAPHITVYGAGTITHIAKRHLAWLEET